MSARARALGAIGALSLLAVACSRPDTVVHLSSNDARWHARGAEGELLCTLPCKLELDEHESVTVVRSDGKTQFVLRQDDLGEGEFSGTVRVRRRQSRGALAGRVFAAALTGAGNALADSENDKHRAAGVFLAGVGAAARAASDIAERDRHELWVERTARND
jgi:hypothetical protein